jgi:outer membrane protein TolC
MVLTAAVLCGCTSVRPPLLSERIADFETPAELRVAPEQFKLAPWWEELADPVLNQLIHEALTHNFSVQAATVRLAQARGIDSATIWSLVPGGSFTQKATSSNLQKYATDGASFSSPPLKEQPTSTGAFTVAWELPLFGKANAVADQGNAQAQQAHWTLKAAELAVSAEIVKAYAEARTAQANTQTLQGSIRTLRQLIDFENTVKAHGVSTTAEVDKLRAQLLDQENYATSSDLRAAQLFAKLDQLLGRADGTTQLLTQTAPVQNWQAQDRVVPKPRSVQASVLRLRPDVRAAEEGVALAAARAGIATANLWPQFSITGELSSTIGSLDAFGSTRGASSTGVTGISLKIPLLDWFALKAESNSKQWELQAVTLEYRQTVVNGWEEARAASAALVTGVHQEELAQQALCLAETEARRQTAFRKAGITSAKDELAAQLAINEKSVQVQNQYFTVLESWAKLVKATFAGAAVSPLLAPPEITTP